VSGEEPVVAARDATRVYPMPAGAVHALRGVSLAVHAGESLALMGPSGCGKSTLLHLLGAVDVPTAGTVTLEGRDTRGLDDSARARLRLTRVGFVFQRFFLLPMLSAYENVLLPMLEARLPRAEREARARELLDYVGLDARRDHRPSQLSGGEMQRVAIARALANRPRLLLADEPTGELDEATGESIARLLARLNQDGLTLVLVTHNPALAARARRTLHLRDGAIVDESFP
jgi:putative ABC transport system ATP-binding protein